MNKREICERLTEIRDYALLSRCGDIAVTQIAADIGSLILDLAAPETEEEKPKAEEKHPGIIAKPGKDGEIEWCWCQKCYAQAAVVHNPFGDGENWSYCQKCGVSFRLKRGEEGEK